MGIVGSCYILMLLLLFSLFFLYSIDLCASLTFEGLDCLDEIVDVTKVVECWHLDDEVASVCYNFVEAGVNLGILGGGKVYLMSEIVLRIDNHRS